MVKQAYFPSKTGQKISHSGTALDVNIQTQSVKSVSQFGTQGTSETNVANCVSLKFASLKCFEIVKRQYEAYGVIFDNCIALEPSNPAFPVHSNLVVLMGGTKGGLLSATFVRPVHLVSTVVTSSQRLLFCGYNSDRQLIAQTILPCANLADSDSALPPNILLSIKASNIHRVTFCAFDGQFTLDNFSFYP